jgi:hypothetical protein
MPKNWHESFALSIAATPDDEEAISAGAGVSAVVGK